MKAFNFDENPDEVVTYKAFTEDDGISKPTKEQYENSKKMRSDLSDWIRRSKKRQDELLDELFKERQAEKDYLGFYKAHQDVVRRYELYEEIAANG
jgi:putative methionine-R-sulfoxide reductase with GAF domain